MIKSIFLNYKSRQATKPKEHGTYEKAQSIGVLYNADEFDLNIINNLIDDISKDQKSVTSLGFTSAKPDPNNPDELIFSKKDISATGTFKRDNVAKFIQQDFDFLISLDTSANINYKFVLTSSKANCKVGFEAEEYENLLLMTMNLSGNKSESVQHLLTYLKKV